MLKVNMHDAKTRLSELVARAVAGEPFVIARAGKPLVKVEALAATDVQSKPNPIGFAKGLWPEVGAGTWAELDREVLQMFEDEQARDGGVTPAPDGAA